MWLRQTLTKALVAIGLVSTPSSAVPQASDPWSAPLSGVPDLPQSFGYKVTWFALPTKDTEKVVEAFQLYDTIPANWAAGLYHRNPPYVVDYTSNYGLVFVAPPVEGWTLVIVENSFDPGSPELQQKLEAHLTNLSNLFGEAQYYGSHRVVSYVSWLRFQKGQITRGLIYIGDSQGYVLNVGDVTPGELELGYSDMTGVSPQDLNDSLYQSEDEENRPYWPDEEDPARLAGYWSINPLTLENVETLPGTGVLGLVSKPPG